MGRGPLAGPVMVGVACVPTDFNWDTLPGVTDSKKLTPARREAVFKLAKKLAKAGELQYEVAAVSAKMIDTIGIVPAITVAMDKALKRLEITHPNIPFDWSINTVNCKVLLDGGLCAPERYQLQETIIKGDSKEQVIGLASIMAKVTRDRYMCRLATKDAYQMYQFDMHKGYGTKQHRASIAVCGLSNQHRKTFCR